MVLLIRGGKKKLVLLKKPFYNLLNACPAGKIYAVRQHVLNGVLRAPGELV
jgi:hypothetical protein